MSETAIKEKRGNRKPRQRNKARQTASASESELCGDSGVSLREPKTPQKGSNRPNTSAHSAANANPNGPALRHPKTRSKLKNIQNSPHVNGSHIHPQANRQSTPPQSASLLRSASMSTPAFAGSTFHASPAPSSLPIPRERKTSPATSVIHEIDSGNSTPTRPSISGSVPIQVEDEPKPCPLDFLFERDRAEKQRAKAVTPRATERGPFPLDTQPHTVPRVNTHAVHFTPPEENHSQSLLDTLNHIAQQSPSSAKSYVPNAPRQYRLAMDNEPEESFRNPAVYKTFNERLRDSRNSHRQQSSTTTYNQTFMTPPPFGTQNGPSSNIQSAMPTPPSVQTSPAQIGGVTMISSVDINASLSAYLKTIPLANTSGGQSQASSHPETSRYGSHVNGYGYPYGPQNPATLYTGTNSPINATQGLAPGYNFQSKTPRELSSACEQSDSSNLILEERLKKILNIRGSN